MCTSANEATPNKRLEADGLQPSASGHRSGAALGSDRIYSHPKGDFLHWIFHGSSTSPKVLTASITRSHPKSSPLSARRCVWKREPECSTSAAGRGRCYAPGHAITESSAPAST